MTACASGDQELLDSHGSLPVAAPTWGTPGSWSSRPSLAGAGAPSWSRRSRL